MFQLTNPLKKSHGISKLQKQMLMYAMVIGGILAGTAQEKAGVAAGHNVATIAHRQVDAVNRDAQYTDWLKAIIKIFDGSLDTRHIGVQMNVEENFDDTQGGNAANDPITVSGDIELSSSRFKYFLLNSGADPYVYHSLLGNENMGSNIAHTRSPDILSATYLTPNALNQISILFHEALGHGSMAGNNSDHDSGKLVNIQINVGSASAPNWVSAGTAKTVMSDGETSGLYLQGATTNPANSTAEPDNYVYLPHPGTGVPNMARVTKSEFAHADPALNTLKLINDHFIAYTQKITNLGDAETVTPPIYTIDTAAGTVTITNPASDHSGSLEIITGTGITNPDNYTLHFYDTSGVLMNPNGDVGYRFKPLYAGQPNPAVNYPAGAAFMAILNDDQNVKSVLVPLEASDTIPPTGVAISAETGPTNATSFVVNYSFSENVAGFTVDDITHTNCTLSGFTVIDAKTYTVTVTPTPGMNGTNVNLNVAAGVLTDVAENPLTSPIDFNILSDQTNIDGAITSPENDPTNIAIIPFNLETYDLPEGLSASDFVVTNGVLQNFAGSGTNYTFEIVPNGDGAVIVTLPAGTFTDEAGNPNDEITFEIESDQTRPTGTTECLSESNSTPIYVDFELSEEPTTILELSNFLVTGGTAVTVTGSGTSWQVEVAPTSGGTITTTLLESAFEDEAGNENLAISNVFDSTLATSDFENFEELEMYPNPVKDRLTIKTANDAIDEIIIFNALGQEVFSKKYDGDYLHIELDVKDLPAEKMYFIKTKSGGKTHVEKFIKE